MEHEAQAQSSTTNTEMSTEDISSSEISRRPRDDVSGVPDGLANTGSSEEHDNVDDESEEDTESESSEDAQDEHEEDDEREEGEDEDSEEDEDDDDEEPALKYERLGGIVSKLLTKDSASTLAHANQRLVSLVQPVVILGL